MNSTAATLQQHVRAETTLHPRSKRDRKRLVMLEKWCPDMQCVCVWRRGHPEGVERHPNKSIADASKTNENIGTLSSLVCLS